MKPLIRELVRNVPYISRLRRLLNKQGAYPVGHYYSPIPSRDDVAAGLQRTHSAPLLTDIDFRSAEQLRLLESMAVFYKDVPFPEKKRDGSRYYFEQPWFSYSDAIMLYGLIRRFGIKKIIEVGSGYSSAVMLDTLESLHEPNFDLTFIEPYPERLKSLVTFQDGQNVKLIQKRIQDVDLGLFSSLQPGDLLFIDSSHVVKFHSDLHVILFDILPRLRNGVLVHFHDIFYPFEYPSDWLLEGRYWNECYLLRAFLSGNTRWEMTLFNHYANLEFPDFISSSMPLCRKNFGGGLYLRKIS